MAYEEKDNNGAAFKNKEKTEDKHPNYKGRAIVMGVPVWVSVWVKKTQADETYLSFAFQKHEPKKEAGQDDL
jgi:hypothetical protein